MVAVRAHFRVGHFNAVLANRQAVAQAVFAWDEERRVKRVQCAVEKNATPTLANLRVVSKIQPSQGAIKSFGASDTFISGVSAVVCKA